MGELSNTTINGVSYDFKDAGAARQSHSHTKSQITDFPTSMPASDVAAWAKASTKPSYTQDEVGDGTTYKRVTSTEKTTWNNKGTYSKPSGGIPKSDLASAVQISLILADGALQHTIVSGSPDLDTYLTTGVYHITTTTATHAPTSNHATLFVDATVGTPYQIFKPDNVDSSWYTRHRSGSAWTSWAAMKFTDTTYSAATTSAAGLMSSTDKSKLDGIATGKIIVTGNKGKASCTPKMFRHGSWISKSWSGLTSFSGSNVWTDGDNIYYSKTLDQYVLNKYTGTWVSKTWSGLPAAGINRNTIWTDGDNIYGSTGSKHYVLNKSTSAWNSKSWSGLVNFYGHNIWTDGTNVYYSSGDNQYVLNKSTSTWVSKTWSGLTSFYGSGIWTDGENIYYSQASDQYVLNKSTSTWVSKTWSGLTSFYGSYIWTDGDDIYLSDGSSEYVLSQP